MELAQKDDVIVLCGKGHETYQEIGHEKAPSGRARGRRVVFGGKRMKELTLKQAAEDCRGTLTPEQAEGMITGVQIDSRKVKPGDLFVAIKGRRSDGHDFIGMAAGLGAQVPRWCKKPGQGGHPDHSCTRYHQGLRRSCRSPPRTDGRDRHRHYRQRRQNDDQGNDRLYAGAYLPHRPHRGATTTTTSVCP